MIPNGDGRHAAPDPASMRRAVDDLAHVIGPPQPWSTPASHAPADAALITYAAACRTCVPDGTLGVAPEHASSGLAIPFATQADRDKWALGHATTRGHTVTLIEQHPGSGSTITGAAEPDPGDGPAPERPAPLVAFVVRDGSPPDMLVRIPPRAAAAWLLTAAHAALLGRGSLGVDQPHRVLYIGRITRTPEATSWTVRIDGLLGATGSRFGAPIGMVCDVDAKLSPSQIEDVCEALIARTCGLGRHAFSVVIMADAPPGDPADPDADAVLRGERLAAMRRRGDDGCVPPAPGG